MNCVKCPKCETPNAIGMKTSLNLQKGKGIDVELMPCSNCGKLYTFKEYNDILNQKHNLKLCECGKTMYKIALNYYKCDCGMSIMYADWKYVKKEQPKNVGRYLCLDVFGNTESILYDCSGAPGEPVSFFEGQIIEAKNIIAWREL